MRYVRLLLMMVLASVMLPSLAQQRFSPAEQAWITAHPRVYYTVNSQWPQESVRDGKHTGLSREVLDEVSRRTGITFVYVPPGSNQPHPPMMNSAVIGNLLSDEQRQRWLLTFPWINTMPIIVATKDQVQLRTLSQMQGKRIAVAADSEFAPWIRRNYPAIQVVVKADVRSALQSVEEGENVAAIASGMVVLPILQRHYINQLGIVAQIPEMVSGVNMGVDPAYPQLRDILNSVMANISARDAERLFAHWVSVVDIGTPTLLFVLWQYRYPLMVIGVLLVLLLAAMRFAWVSRRRAIRSERHKSQFLAIMSHEVRTPMNAIIAALELLQQSTGSAKRQQYIDLAYSSSQDLLELLNSVLDHEKINQNRLALNPEPVAIGPLLEAVIDSQRPAAQRKSLTLSFEDVRSDTHQWALIDAHRLRQIVNNLISNAIKFTERGGVMLRIDDRNGRLSILVQDSGVGIAPALQNKLMQAWQQGEHQAGGSGLGLYICRSLVTQMQGTMQLSSEAGQGTQVMISLPLQRVPKGNEQENPHRLTLPDFAQHCSILVVEDHMANRQLLAEQLTRLACHFELAEDGEKALQLFEEENYYDIILLDCGLPGMDGYTVARQIRQLEQQQQRDRTVIIAISALQSASHFAHCRESGMDGVLSKPIRLRELAAELKKWCQPAGITTSDDAPATEIADDIWQSLQQDVQAFAAATAQQQTRYMVHHIHRIKGVALMYQLHALAEFAATLEASLRADLPAEQWQAAQWQQQLITLTSPPNPCK
ncbi:ATP-binding protein [Pantoea dispersa]|uniref:ATP-binding protein n=1 Tax=Pantoea dispersa TaxID=59814 RepID=UPI002DBAD080|nr:ATP-binding protein [Pantoea dispersa]MEB5972552.1 ATP-binding protein [Pantoea dispersa]